MRFSLFLLTVLLFSACQKEESCESISPQEMYEKAQKLLKPNVENESSDYSAAMKCLLQAAEGGLLRAQLDLGGVYFSGGHGVQADPQKAYNWFSLAAAQGSKEAEVFLGILHYDGSLGKQDKEAALKHWRSAAEAGIAEGQYRLGRVLAREKETIQEGIEWLEKAAAAVPQAATALGNVYYQHLQDGGSAAAVWYEKGALAGDPMAQHVFAEMLLLGDPVEQDEDRGLAMLRMAAGQDYKPAMARLINILRNSKNAKESENEAAAWDARLQELMKIPAEQSQK